MVISQCALQRDEANFLQNDVPVGIGKNLLLDPISPLQFGVRQVVNRNAGFNRYILELAVHSFLRNKLAPSVTIRPMSRVHAWSTLGK